MLKLILAIECVIVAHIFIITSKLPRASLQMQCHAQILIIQFMDVVCTKTYIEMKILTQGDQNRMIIDCSNRNTSPIVYCRTISWKFGKPNLICPTWINKSFLLPACHLVYPVLVIFFLELEINSDLCLLFLAVLFISRTSVRKMFPTS